MSDNILIHESEVNEFGQMIYLATHDLSGICQIELVDEGVLEIAYISVLTSARGKRIGSKLLLKCEEIARSKNIKTIKLLVLNESWMFKWYESYGYIEIGKYPERDDYSWMEKQLD